MTPVERYKIRRFTEAPKAEAWLNKVAAEGYWLFSASNYRSRDDGVITLIVERKYEKPPVHPDTCA